MSDVVAPEQQLTRRQLRELRNGATAEPLIAADRDSVETETLPLPTRRTMREHAPVQKRSNVRHAPRAAVLTTLGVATIAAPLTGFVSPEQSAQAILSLIHI